MSKTKLALDVVENLRSLAESIEAVVAVMTDNDTATAAPADNPTNSTAAANSTESPAESTSPTEKPMTLVELRAFVAERSTPENRPKIKEILTRYGVKKLTELPDDKFAAVKREVAAL